MGKPNMKTNVVHEEDDEEEEDEWELARAFAEDTRLSTNWPPRSYTCTFCTREFRSAQALGGHMNVHRRDRAHLHQAQAQAQPQTAATTTDSMYWPNLDGGSTLFYELANYDANSNNLGGNYSSPANFRFVNDYEMQAEVTHQMSHEEENYAIICSKKNLELNKEVVAVEDYEELDLELRLGHKPASSEISRLMNNNNNNVDVLHWR